MGVVLRNRPAQDLRQSVAVRSGRERGSEMEETWNRPN